MASIHVTVLSHPADGYSYYGCTCEDCTRIRGTNTRFAALLGHNTNHRFTPDKECHFCNPLPIAIEQTHREARPTNAEEY